MCYSAQIWADYKRYVRAYGVELSLKEFYDLFWRRQADTRIKIPKAMEDAFSQPQSDAERDIKALIDAYAAEQSVKLEQELFKQRKRLADAQRALQTKITKARVGKRAHRHRQDRGNPAGDVRSASCRAGVAYRHFTLL